MIRIITTKRRSQLIDDLAASKEESKRLKRIIGNILDVVIVWRKKRIGNLKAITMIAEYLKEAADELEK